MSLNAALDNPAGWGITNGTDAASVADTEAPGGSHCAVDFAGDTTMVTRLTLTGTNKLADWRGECFAVSREAAMLATYL